MKKLFAVMLVAAFIFGVFANVAVAEDRFALSGAVRVRAWTIDNSDFDTLDDDKYEYWDQRFRVQGTITPADGVKAVFRVDLFEDIWGGNNWTGSRPSAGVNASTFGDVSSSEAGELQVDRAYLDITKGIVNIKAGEAYWGLGNNYAYDNNQPGIGISIKTPVVISAGFLKIDEDPLGSYGTSTDLTDDENYEDVNHYFVNVGYKSDAFSVDVFYAMQQDDTAAEVQPTLIGAMGKFGIGPVNVMAELDMFGGDSAAGEDYVGMQFIADASMKMSDALTLGLQLVYSDGTDDANETKLVRMPNAFFGSLYYANYGAFAPDAPNLLGSGDVMDPLGTESGAMGGGIYATFKPIDVLTLAGNVMYLTGVEDSVGTMFDSGYVINATAEYMIAQNATIAVGYMFADVEKVSVDTDSATAYVARFQVGF